MLRNFDRFVCVVKKTAYDHYHEKKSAEVSFLRLSENFRSRVLASHRRQIEFADRLKELTEALHLPVEFFPEHRLGHVLADEKTLLMSCGGDGTFLTCAQTFPRSVLLGLNSDYTGEGTYDGSLGALTSLNILNFKDKLLALHKGQGRIEEWSRLGVSVNEKKLDRQAVNEIYIGNPVSYLTCDLSLDTDLVSDDFNCSGLLVCTGMGSNAWFAAAGGSSFSNELKAFGFIVLVPSQKWHPKFVSGVASYEKRLIVRPHRDGYILSFDSKTETIKLKAGDRVNFFLDMDNPVRVLKIP